MTTESEVRLTGGPGMSTTEAPNTADSDKAGARGPVRSGARSFPPAAQVCGRDRAVLRAVAAGRGGLRAGCEPLLVVDGIACADSGVARRLIAAGLIAAPVDPADAVRLTPAGHAALGPGLVQA